MLSKQPHIVNAVKGFESAAGEEFRQAGMRLQRGKSSQLVTGETLKEAAAIATASTVLPAPARRTGS